MAIPIDFETVFIWSEALSQSFPGGIDGFVELIPNLTFIEDRGLTAVSFMATQYATEFIDDLIEQGLGIHLDNQRNFAIVNQSTLGSELPEWLELGMVENQKCAWLKGLEPGKLILPPEMIAIRGIGLSIDQLKSAFQDKAIEFIIPENEGDEMVKTELRKGEMGLDVWCGISWEHNKITGLISILPVRWQDDQKIIAEILDDVRMTLKELGIYRLGAFMGNRMFIEGEEIIVKVPIYRWVSIIPLRWDVSKSPSDPEELFFALHGDETLDRSYICWGDRHGPFPFGEIQRKDYERESGVQARNGLIEAVISKPSWMDRMDKVDLPSAKTMRELQREISVWPDDAVSFHLLVDCNLERERLHEIGWTLWEFNERVILDCRRGRGWLVVLGVD
jgi:hypothetical protein